MTNRSFIGILAILASTAISFGCEHLNGERTVSGKLPLDRRTVEAEKMANSLTPPQGTVLLETSITSKDDLGVVTKKYSTDLHCKEVNLFFCKYYTSSGWEFVDSEKKGPFNQDTFSTFAANEFKTDVWCTEQKDFRGMRMFYLSYYWRKNE